MTVLKPCPFCPDGGDPEITTYEVYSLAMYSPDKWKVVCQKCDVTMDGKDTEEEATNAWNTRANEQQGGAE